MCLKNNLTRRTECSAGVWKSGTEPGRAGTSLRERRRCGQTAGKRGNALGKSETLAERGSVLSISRWNNHCSKMI